MPHVKAPRGQDPSACYVLPAVLPAGMGHSTGGMRLAQKHHLEASAAPRLPTTGLAGLCPPQSAAPGTQAGGKREGNISKKLGGLGKALLGTGSFLLLFLIYFFLIKANEVELQERCKSLIGESFSRALPDGLFRYENITAGSWRRKFPSGCADWMERKTPPSSDVFSEEGQIPGIFPSSATLRSFLQVPWVPPPPVTKGTLRGGRQWPGTPWEWHRRVGVWDERTDAPGMLSWDSCSPRAGDGCSGRFMGGSSPWEKNQGGAGGRGNLQKPVLPQPKCLDVRHRDLVHTIKVWFESHGLVATTKLLCFPSFVSALKLDLF